MASPPQPIPKPDLTDASDDGLDLRLSDLYAIVLMQWRLIVATAAGVLVLSVLYNLIATRIYASTASVHLSTVTGQELKVDKVVDKDVYNRLDRKYFTETQVQIIESRTLREEVIRQYIELGYDNLDAKTGPGALLAKMTVKPRRNSEIIDISVTDPVPERAAVLANLVPWR